MYLSIMLKLHSQEFLFLGSVFAHPHFVVDVTMFVVYEMVYLRLGSLSSYTLWSPSNAHGWSLQRHIYIISAMRTLSTARNGILAYINCSEYAAWGLIDLLINGKRLNCCYRLNDITASGQCVYFKIVTV